MKTLNEFVLDRATPEYHFMLIGGIPLSPSVLKAFEVPIKKAYHSTDAIDFANLIKLQNKRIDISVFTRGSRGIASGLETGGQVLVELSGKTSFQSDVDFYSKVDRNGRRWYSPRITPKFMRKEFVAKIKKRIDEKYPEFRYLDTDGSMNFVERFPTGRDKKEFIKFYYDEAKKIMNRSFIEKLVKTIVDNERNGSRLSHNEFLLHDFKIHKVFVVDNLNSVEVNDRVTASIEKLGFKVSGIMSTSDVTNIKI